jgi:hypothetical protein
MVYLSAQNSDNVGSLVSEQKCPPFRVGHVLLWEKITFGWVACSKTPVDGNMFETFTKVMFENNTEDRFSKQKKHA